jgi:hypothetical protein
MSETLEQQQHHPFCTSQDASTCPCYVPQRAISTPVPEDPEREAIALLITCPDCHAPVDVRCVAQMWTCRNGAWEPYCVPRHAHSRRVKAARKYRLMPDPTVEITQQGDER